MCIYEKKNIIADWNWNKPAQIMHEDGEENKNATESN